jgi:putative flippase GtrA
MNLPPRLAPVVQLGRFGAVGALATLTHALSFAAAIEALHARPLLANALGFVLALCVSFFGHRHWTFRAEVGGRPDAPAMFLKFAIVALTGLLLNSLIVVVVVEQLGLDYRLAMLLMVTVVPLLLFWQCKRFAFR